MRDPYPVRFEWRAGRSRRAGPSSSYLVIVDVLSFSTSVTVAAEAGDPGLPLVGSPSEKILADSGFVVVFVHYRPPNQPSSPNPPR